MKAYQEERVTDEPHITDRLMGAIEHGVSIAELRGALSRASDPVELARAPRDPSEPVDPAWPDLSTDDDSFDDAGLTGFDEVEEPRVVWRAMTLRSGSRSAAHEKRFGADILGVLSFQSNAFDTSKGFLAQAKRSEPGVPFTNGEWLRFQEQCRRMLSKTPASFAMIYSLARGIRMVSAEAIANFSGNDVFALYDMGLQQFFERHIECFIGDRRLSKPHISVLERLEYDVPDDEKPSSHVLHLKATLTE